MSNTSVSEITTIEIPSYAFSIAYSLAKSRAGRFRNQFTTKKIREENVGDDPELAKYVEGVIGYIGDMCAAKWLGLDPKELMRDMIVDTDLLTHRDEYDLVYRGNRVDVKTEFYPNEVFEKAIRRQLQKKERYGCRLINDNQFRENSPNIDIYIFATLDSIDPRKAKKWYVIGWIFKDKVHEVAPKPMWWSPAGARLWVPAHCIPNSDLSEPDNIMSVSKGKFINYNSYKDNPKYTSLDEQKFIEICSKAGLL